MEPDGQREAPLERGTGMARGIVSEHRPPAAVSRPQPPWLAPHTPLRARLPVDSPCVSLPGGCGSFSLICTNVETGADRREAGTV